MTNAACFFALQKIPQRFDEFEQLLNIWNPGRTFEKINQIEIDKESAVWRFSAMIAAFMISVTYKLQEINMTAINSPPTQDDNILIFKLVVWEQIGCVGTKFSQNHLRAKRVVVLQ